MTFRFSVLLFFAALTPLAHAQFTGDFSFNPPAAGNFTANTTLGAWTFSTNAIGSSFLNNLGTLDVHPSFALQTSAAGGSSLAEPGTALLSLSLLQGGNLSFDYHVVIELDGGGSGSIVHLGLLGDPHTVVSTISGSLNLAITPGDTLYFETTAYGDGFDNVATGLANLGISNFSFIPAVIPESGTWALFAGLGSLGAVMMKKKRPLAA